MTTKCKSFQLKCNILGEGEGEGEGQVLEWCLLVMRAALAIQATEATPAALARQQILLVGCLLSYCYWCQLA